MKEKPPVLSDFELEEIYEGAYLKACEFSESYPTGLSSEHWMPSRPSERQRYFNETSRDVIQRATAQAQRDADVAYYEPIIQAEIEGLFETIEAMYPELKQGYWENKNWQSLKDKWLKEAKNGSSIKNATT